jgi:hypothetical protein
MVELNKSLTMSKKFQKPLFPLVKKEEDEKSSTSETTEESEESDSSALSSEDVSSSSFSSDECQGKAREFMKRALVKYGYPEELLENEGFCAAFAKALVKNGEIVTQRTGRAWIERAIPEEAPAFVRPGKLKIGDKVQVLNWVPLGVHGTTVDLFPHGGVSKIYTVKCLVTKDPIGIGCMPTRDADFMEEERVIGLELDGRGPYTKKSQEGSPYPYVTKDSTVIVRFPPYAEPSGETSHFNPTIT